ncbi:XdhC family protein [Ammoniphilus sp. YIM 78166]|uniref:XdhC family protein n=1 Tax=Ammoniphilus sp. YIM 78166 TaxID=1644106 RepID=UPI00106FBD71|nr:XdhC family protein [Ammoniphilus sp. YIM 78166]
MISKELVIRLKAEIEQGYAAAVATITRHSVDEEKVGQRYLVTRRDEGPGDDPDYPRIHQAVTPLLLQGKSKTISIPLKSGEVECFVEIIQPQDRLVVAGAGHVAESISRMGKWLGFHVTVVDDREVYASKERFPDADEVVCQSFRDFFEQLTPTPQTYILLLTRGHKFDVLILQQLLQKGQKPAYLGMIGSKRRISGVRSQTPLWDNVHAPIGLDLGAETPEEISVSVFAEILKLKNGKSGRSLCDL